MDILTIVLIVLGVVALLVIGIYNSLASSKVAISEAHSGIEVQMKRRADLVPNLIETVKGYTKHESEVFTKVADARQKMLSANGVKEEAAANNMLAESLKSVFAIAESYPDLKASTNFSSLQSELSDIEAKISYARQFYNNNVKALNSKIVTFPTNILAGMFGFKEEQFFDAEEGVEKPVQVKF
jgi:LemA protein